MNHFNQRNGMRLISLKSLMMFMLAQVAIADSTTGIQSLSTEQVNKFANVMALIKHQYYEDRDYDALFDNAIEGMMRGLDPHSAYIAPDKMKSFTDASTGLYGGLGMEVEADKEGAVKVVSSFDDTPAKRAGLKSGDLILAINDTILQHMDLTAAVKLMKGKPNTTIELTVLHEGKRKPEKIKITREIIKFAAVKSKVIDEHVGYIRIATFNDKTFHQVVKAIQNIKKLSNDQLHGVVIDVRDNPGGLLDSVTQISDLFLDSKKLKNKVIVSVKGRASPDIVKKATKGDTLNGLPIVVITNKGSASASEILAAALKDHNRAVVVGTETFGKGSVQSVIPLGTDSLIKLTTALYYTPNDVSIQANGVMPDIYVNLKELPKPDQEESAFANLSESSFLKHFKNMKNENENKQLIHAEKEKMHLAHEDFQLYQAVRIIEGLHSMEA